MSGEYPTASAMAFWLSCQVLQRQAIPNHMIKRPLQQTSVQHLVIYNNFKGAQHSFMLLTRDS
jgi:3-oxoacyl-[acyl-carrier-protein] synthase II